LSDLIVITIAPTMANNRIKLAIISHILKFVYITLPILVI